MVGASSKGTEKCEWKNPKCTLALFALERVCSLTIHVCGGIARLAENVSQPSEESRAIRAMACMSNTDGGLPAENNVSSVCETLADALAKRIRAYLLVWEKRRTQAA